MLTYNPAERHSFRDALTLHIAATFPDASLSWIEDGRRLMLHFPEGAICTLWEPNFFFSLGSYAQDDLLRRAVSAIAAQRAQLARQLGD